MRLTLLALVVLSSCSTPGRSRQADGGEGGQGGGGGQPDDDGGNPNPTPKPTACGGGATVGSPGNPWKNPIVQCKWSPSTPGEGLVIDTPLVIDLDGDGKPEIVFRGEPSTALFNACEPGDTKLYAIRGDDCSEVWHVDADTSPYSEMAAGDLDGDGKPEIVGFNCKDKVLHVFNSEGKMIATSPSIPEWGVPPDPALGQGGGPAIADVDGDGIPEIYIYATVMHLEGGQLKVLWSKGAQEGFWGPLSIMADVDLDGRPELITGNRIFDGMTGMEKTPAGMAKLHPGYPAVAQIDPSTPEPEIVLLQSWEVVTGELVAVNPKSGKIVFGPYQLPVVQQKADYSPGPPSGGGPVIADFDGDGQPDIGTSSPNQYLVYSPSCAVTPLPAKCKGPGLLWSSEIRDLSSGGTSSSVFDFNCDKRAEVVYRDECWLRIFDGVTGEVHAAYNITSGTILEEPVIADVDGNGTANIVVSSDNVQQGMPGTECPKEAEKHTGTPWTGYTHGVFVLRDPEDRWVTARRIWNQNPYHVTNVYDNGTIPAKEMNSWDVFNNYRQNVAAFGP